MSDTFLSRLRAEDAANAASSPPAGCLTPYGKAVLDNQVPVMAAARKGVREATLLRLGCLIGGYIAGGEIPYQVGHDALRDAALSSGLPEREVSQKLARHLEHGMTKPLRAPTDWTPGRPVAATTVLREKALPRSALRSLPRPKPLIAGVLYEATTGLIYGRWGSGKSFISLDLACCLATGKPWQGRPVKQSRVLYIAAEGAYGYQARVEAWERAWAMPIADQWLTFFPEPINLSTAADELCTFVSDEQFDVVFVDTLARCAVGSDENSARDAGVIVDAMSSVRNATPGGLGTVVAIHHSGKDGLTLRGSTSFEGGVDTVYQVTTHGARIKLACTKQKDAAGGDTHYLKLNPTFGSCVVEIDRGEDSSAKGVALATLSGAGRMPRKDLIDRVEGFHPKHVEKAIRQLITTGAITKIEEDDGIEYVQVSGF